MLKRFQRRSLFYFANMTSPTYVNLAKTLRERGWRRTRIPSRSNFHESYLDFNPTAANQLEYKHQLAALMEDNQQPIMPTTYAINDDNWEDVLQIIARSAKANAAWILKPAMLNNGQHIHLFQSCTQVEEHYLQSARMGGQHVLQEYLQTPHLIAGPQGLHKYSVRLLLTATTHMGCYLYPHGYFNVSRFAYQPQDFTDNRCHLTNEHLGQGEANVVQIPTDHFDYYPEIFQQAKVICQRMIDRWQAQHQQLFTSESPPRFAIYGIDFMVDDDMQVWLLEANHGPCFPISEQHPLQNHLYRDFWHQWVSGFIEGQMVNTPFATLT